uniref:Acyl-Coenzyme A dehydrogenase family, member 8 n=1 Tax=Mus musculus TaxID=10090 RepID=D6RDD5_MOUSE
MAMLRSGYRRFGCLRAALKSLAQTHHRSITFCIDQLNMSGPVHSFLGAK